jgi:23S rRNA pseudouridine1911/1915/1917 synthase
LGDPIYRKQVPHFAKELAFHRQALHAFALGLQHPQTEQLCNWYQAPPSDFMALLQLVQIDASALPTDVTGSLS